MTPISIRVKIIITNDRKILLINTERQVNSMNRRTKNALLDVAAELIVSPIALYAKAVELKGKFDESEAGQKTHKVIKQAGSDISSAAKGFAESETGQLIKDTAKKTGANIRETAQKVADSEAVQKVRETAQKVADSEAYQKVKDTVTDTFQKVSESETVQKVKDTATETYQKVSDSQIIQGAKEKIDEAREKIDEVREFLKGEAGEKEEAVADIIDDVDFSQIVTKEDQEEFAQEEGPAPIDEEESAKEFEAEAEKLEAEIADQLEKQSEE